MSCAHPVHTFTALLVMLLVMLLRFVYHVTHSCVTHLCVMSLLDVWRASFMSHSFMSHSCVTSLTPSDAPVSLMSRDAFMCDVTHWWRIEVWRDSWWVVLVSTNYRVCISLIRVCVSLIRVHSISFICMAIALVTVALVTGGHVLPSLLLGVCKDKNWTWTWLKWLSLW